MSKAMDRCIVIGAINMDIRGICGRSIVMGDSNPGKVRMSPGGVGRNIAHNLSLLGGKAELLTALSDDSSDRYWKHPAGKRASGCPWPCGQKTRGQERTCM